MKNSALLTIALFFVCIGCRNKTAETDDTKKTVPEVHFVNPRIETMHEYITLNGTSLFLQKEVVRSTVTGYITEVYSTIGEHIKQGEKLFAVKTSEAYAMNAKSDTGLFSRSIAIKSSKSGVLSVLSCQPGSYVQQGDVLAELTEPENLVVQISVPYEFNDLIRTGKECSIVLPGGKQLTGYVFRIMPLVDKLSQTQNVYVKLKSFTELPENLNVTVQILKSSKEKAMTVPKNAVLSNETQDKFRVMKIVNDTLAVEIPVVKGLENDGEIEIISPQLLLTDKIITQGGYGLPDSSAVKPLK